MPFFEPLPEPPPHEVDLLAEREWSPPAWDRPSEGTLPAVLGISRLLARTDGVALALDEVRVYPNGFQLVTSSITNPRLPPALHMGGFATLSLVAARSSRAGEEKKATTSSPQWLHHPGLRMSARIGVEFSDGRRAGTGQRSPYAVERDDDGMPTEPIITMGGGGGGGGRFRSEHWVFPLPSPGDLVVFAEWAVAGIEETSIVISADDIRDAARRAIVLWS